MRAGARQKNKAAHFAKVEDWRTFTREFQNESDRAAAVLGAAWLDARLERLLAGFLVQDSKAVAALFESFGPLSTFSARIRMAYTLGLISKAAFDDLSVIRDVRNRFAHDLHGVGFGDGEITHACQRLQLPLLPVAAEVAKDLAISDARSAFEMAVGVLAVLLDHAAESGARERRRPRDTEKWPRGRRTRG